MVKWLVAFSAQQYLVSPLYAFMTCIVLECVHSSAVCMGNQARAEQYCNSSQTR